MKLLKNISLSLLVASMLIPSSSYAVIEDVSTDDTRTSHFSWKEKAAVAGGVALVLVAAFFGYRQLKGSDATSAAPQKPATEPNTGVNKIAEEIAEPIQKRINQMPETLEGYAAALGSEETKRSLRRIPVALAKFIPTSLFTKDMIKPPAQYVVGFVSMRMGATEEIIETRVKKVGGYIDKAAAFFTIHQAVSPQQPAAPARR